MSFRDQITKGGPVTVTHRGVTRYFMTISEAVQLVIQAGAIGSTGEILVLDMGKPVNIYEVAEQLARNSGKPIKISPVEPIAPAWITSCTASEIVMKYLVTPRCVTVTGPPLAI